MNVTVAEVLAGAEVRAVPLSAECVGYLVLAAADQISAAPRRVEPNDVLLFEDGGIRVASGRSAEGPLAERDLRAVLDALLLRASGPTSGLLRASRRAPGAGVDALVRELETALIPVNRSAAKRSLARLERETVRALQSGRISSLPPAVNAPEPAPVPSTAASLSNTPRVPAPPLAEIPELSPAPRAAVPREPSSVPPPVVTVRERRSPPPPSARAALLPSLPHAPVAALISTLPPPPDRGALEESPIDGVSGETIVLARVAPKHDNDPELVETRPEPVVQRASARPPAPLPNTTEPVKTEPLTFVRSRTAHGAEPLVVTPPNVEPRVTISTRATPAQAEPSTQAASEVTPNFALATRDATSVPPAAFLAVSTFEGDVALARVAVELDAKPQVTPVLGTRVERESALPPAVRARGATTHSFDVAAVSETDASSDEVPLTFDADAALELGFDDDGDIDVLEVFFDANDLAAEAPALVATSELTEPCPPLDDESLLPAALVTAERGHGEAKYGSPTQPSPVAQTPPPRLALPKPRQSDIEDLLRGLEEQPLTDDEIRKGLKTLAGMEPTPPPPGLPDDS